MKLTSEETQGIAANKVLEEASAEYDGLIDVINVTMEALAAEHKRTIAPYINELDEAKAAYQAVNEPAAAVRAEAESEARAAYERAVEIARADLARALEAERKTYIEQTSVAEQTLTAARKRHDAKVKELNRRFQEESAQHLTGLHQKEFELTRKVRRLGVTIRGLSSKRPTVLRHLPRS